MTKQELTNVNILSERLLPSPVQIHAMSPATHKAAQTVANGREAIKAILDRRDPRLLAIVGPCSIHDPSAALEFCDRLIALSNEVSDRIVIMMRVYFEKPRTTVGWKGFINDPFLDNSCQIEKGLIEARKLLVEILSRGMPTATEVLDPFTPQFIGELVCWSSIGARTVESQTHRQLASGLSTPVGVKNGTYGAIDVAVNGILAMSRPHQFLGIQEDGRTAIFETSGNPYCHMVLRGGEKPNYDKESVDSVATSLVKAELPPNIMVDCSHGNSSKDHRRQPEVLLDVVGQKADGNQSIIGVMLESNISEGRQNLTANLANLEYGVSITDACIGWETTEDCIRKAYDLLK